MEMIQKVCVVSFCVSFLITIFLIPITQVVDFSLLILLYACVLLWFLAKFCQLSLVCIPTLKDGHHLLVLEGKPRGFCPGVGFSLAGRTNSPLSLLTCRPHVKISSPVRGEQCL